MVQFYVQIFNQSQINVSFLTTVAVISPGSVRVSSTTLAAVAVCMDLYLIQKMMKVLAFVSVSNGMFK